jgi:hypothetical protein
MFINHNFCLVLFFGLPASSCSTLSELTCPTLQQHIGRWFFSSYFTQGNFCYKTLCCMLEIILLMVASLWKALFSPLLRETLDAWWRSLFHSCVFPHRTLGSHYCARGDAKPWCENENVRLPSIITRFLWIRTTPEVCSYGLIESYTTILAIDQEIYHAPWRIVWCVDLPKIADSVRDSLYVAKGENGSTIITKTWQINNKTPLPKNIHYTGMVSTTLRLNLVVNKLPSKHWS